jgi:hypothetical protein
MAKMKSRLPDRRNAAQAIEDMAADLQARGLALYAVHPSFDDNWMMETVDGNGDIQSFIEATLDECYLAAMNYPDTPPPF